MNIGIGEKVKELRQDKGISLNEVSNRAELSATYLSKFERGLVPINVDNLQKVCEALGVTIQYFIGTPKSSGAEVIRSYERQVDLKGDSYIHYNLSNIEDCGDFLPRYVDMWICFHGQTAAEIYSHPLMKVRNWYMYYKEQWNYG